MIQFPISPEQTTFFSQEKPWKCSNTEANLKKMRPVFGRWLWLLISNRTGIIIVSEHSQGFVIVSETKQLKMEILWFTVPNLDF